MYLFFFAFEKTTHALLSLSLMLGVSAGARCLHLINDMQETPALTLKHSTRSVSHITLIFCL